LGGKAESRGSEEECGKKGKAGSVHRGTNSARLRAASREKNGSMAQGAGEMSKKTHREHRSSRKAEALALKKARKLKKSLKRKLRRGKGTRNSIEAIQTAGCHR